MSVDVFHSLPQIVQTLNPIDFIFGTLININMKGLLLLLFIQAIYDYMALHNTSHFWMSMVKYEYHRW